MAPGSLIKGYCLLISNEKNRTFILYEPPPNVLSLLWVNETSHAINYSNGSWLLQLGTRLSHFRISFFFIIIFYVNALKVFRKAVSITEEVTR